MPSGTRQHLVPQMMIRRFAGSDGKLSELFKPSLSIGTRRRSPKGVLFLDDYYRDHLSDFDEELLTPIEQKFRTIYSSLADDTPPPRLTGKEGAAFIDWVASLLVRTRAHACLGCEIAKKSAGLTHAAWLLAPALMSNIARTFWFEECQDLLSRPSFRWKVATFSTSDTIVLSDNPVFLTNGLAPSGMVVVVPLSARRVFFGGRQEIIDRCTPSIRRLNAFLAAWAERSIFAAEADVLDHVIEDLKGEGAINDPQWCEAAIQPFFGFVARVARREIAPDVDVNDWWTNVKDSYGDSILPWKR